MSTQTTQNPLRQVVAHGQSIWYDGLISKKDFERMIREDGIRGATTNPTIFEKALSGTDYDADLAALKRLGVEEIFRSLAVKAVQEVADVFDGVYRQTEGEDGYVSMEVSPLLAYDTRKTVEEARLLHRSIGRKNVMIKVPATREGVPAIETLISEGIHVNVTLIFSIERYREVMDAYLSGLERRAAAGQPVSDIASVASFFVSRVDTAVDKILEEKAAALPGEEGRRHAAFLGKIAIANSRVAYQEFEKIFASPRFAALKAKGARVQRPLWASTGTKNPKYGDVFYVEALIGPQTVDTIPPATLDAFRDHGRAASRIREGAEEARKAIDALPGVGVNLNAITQGLEDAGVQSFAESYQKILKTIEAKIS